MAKAIARPTATVSDDAEAHQVRIYKADMAGATPGQLRVVVSLVDSEGASAQHDVPLASLGTAEQRSAFRAILAAAVNGAIAAKCVDVVEVKP